MHILYITGWGEDKNIFALNESTLTAITLVSQYFFHGFLKRLFLIGVAVDLEKSTYIVNIQNNLITLATFLIRVSAAKKSARLDGPAEGA